MRTSPQQLINRCGMRAISWWELCFTWASLWKIIRQVIYIPVFLMAVHFILETAEGWSLATHRKKTQHSCGGVFSTLLVGFFVFALTFLCVCERKRESEHFLPCAHGFFQSPWGPMEQEAPQAYHFLCYWLCLSLVYGKHTHTHGSWQACRLNSSADTLTQITPWMLNRYL